MEQVCKNCDYFVQVSLETGTYCWGDCTKPDNCTDGESGNKTRIAFTWADKTCKHFKQKPQSQQDSQVSG